MSDVYDACGMSLLTTLFCIGGLLILGGINELTYRLKFRFQRWLKRKDL